MLLKRDKYFKKIRPFYHIKDNYPTVVNEFAIYKAAKSGNNIKTLLVK